MRAFASADEEEGQKTLHQHWQIWAEEINQTLRNALFDNYHKTRNRARQTFQEHIDNVVSTSYGPQFCITHKCIGEKDQETSKTGIPESLFKEEEPDCLCWARHKDLCNDIGGGIIFCQDCEQPISTTDIMNQSLKRWKDTVIQEGARAQDKRPDTNISLSPERLDMAAYTFSYHMNGGCALESDPFWGHNDIPETLLKYRFEEHSACHCALCFKKGCKYRFLFPFMSTCSTYIHEDRGDNNNNETLWFCLKGSFNSVYPFMFIPKRPWAVSSSMHTINQSQKFSISIHTSKLEMRCKFSTALCTQTNQHKMKTANNSCILGMQS